MQYHTEASRRADLLLLLAALLAACLAAVDSAWAQDRNASPGVANGALELRLVREYTTQLRWRVACRPIGTTSAARGFGLVLIGNGTDPKKAAEWRRKVGCWYLLAGSKITLSNARLVGTGDQQAFRFRVADGPLWADADVRLVGRLPVVLVRTVATSHPWLFAHWRVGLDQPMQQAVHDHGASDTGYKWIDAKRAEHAHVYPRFMRYGALFRADGPTWYGFFRLPRDRRSPMTIQIPRGGGLGAVFLNPPFAVGVGVNPSERDAATFGHLAEGLGSQFRQALSKVARAGDDH